MAGCLCDNLLSWWSMDEPTDPRVDLGPAGLDAVTPAGQDVPGSATGRVGDCAEFIAASSGPIPGTLVADEAAATDTYSPDDSFWCGGWFRFADHEEGTATALFLGTVGSNYSLIYYEPDVLEVGQAILRFQIEGADTTLANVDAPVDAPAGEWHWVMAWYDADLATINLQFDTGAVTPAALGALPLTGNTALRFVNGVPGVVIDPLRFYLDEWVFGKGCVLSESDRTWLYNDGNGQAYADLAESCAGTLSVELTETLALIIADPATLTSDPSLPPAGGSGLPTRFVDSDGGFTDSCDPIAAGATVCTRTRRVLPAGIAAHLAGTALTLAYCLSLERRDGEVFGFTTHDANLTFGGVTYEALNSLSVTALRQEVGGGIGNMDLSGLIRSDRVTAADLLAGRYDGAELTLLLVNWADLSDGTVTLARGWFGAVTLVDGSWKAEYRSLGQRFAQEVVEVTSALCTVRQLGDARCAPGGVFANGQTLSHYQFTRTVTAVLDTRRMTFGADTHASNYYAAGRVVFSSGANDGLEREVKAHTRTAGQAVLVLAEGMPFLVEVGDTAMLEAGCDRRLQVCKGRFHNTANYQGFPHVPGFDVLKRLKQANLTG